MFKNNFLKTIIFVFSFLFIFHFLFVNYTFAAIDKIVFINEPQTIKAGDFSARYQIQLQNLSGEREAAPDTTYFTLPLDLGMFSSTNKDDAKFYTASSTIYISTGDYNKYFYFKSDRVGEYQLKIQARNKDNTKYWETEQIVKVVGVDENIEMSSTSTDNQISEITVLPSVSVSLSSHSDPEDLSDYNKNRIFEVSAGRERMALVGSNLEFDAKYRFENIESCTPSFLWSFGDGYSYSGKKVFHIYKNQGEYNVVLNATCGDESAVSRTKVKIYNPEIEIVSIEDRNIEIKNKSSIEINIGGWSIKNYQKDLILPKDTIISPRQSIILSSDYLKLGSILQNVSLIDESKNEISSVFVNLPDSTVLSSNNLEKEEKTIPITNQQSEILSVSNSLDVVISPIQKIVEEDIIDTNLSTVYEPEIATHKSSIISRIVSFPIKAIKSFFSLFYDF